MKKLILTLFISFVFYSALGQRFILDQFMSFTVENDEWVVDTELKEIFVVSLLDLENQTFTIFSKDTQKYQFVKSIDIYEDDPNIVESFLALDQDDDLCIFHHNISKKNDIYTFYIEYKDFVFVYTVKKDL